jgi:hypothetical protein
LITDRAWHLPVTESLRSRHNKAVSMSNIQKFDLRGVARTSYPAAITFRSDHRRRGHRSMVNAAVAQ